MRDRRRNTCPKVCRPQPARFMPLGLTTDHGGVARGSEGGRFVMGRNLGGCCLSVGNNSQRGRGRTPEGKAGNLRSPGAAPPAHSTLHYLQANCAPLIGKQWTKKSGRKYYFTELTPIPSAPNPEKFKKASKNLFPSKAPKLVIISSVSSLTKNHFKGHTREAAAALAKSCFSFFFGPFLHEQSLPVRTYFVILSEDHTQKPGRPSFA